MPATLTYPGVYIEEIPSGVRTITGVATSITAFVGRALRGPVDKAVTINSYGDFERIFGGLWAESSLGFAVRDFYLNGGSQAIIVRLFTPTFESDTERLAAFNAARDKAQIAADAVAEAAKEAAELKGSNPASVKEAALKAADAAASAGAVAKSAADAVAKATADAAAVSTSTSASVAAAATGAVASAVKAAANKAAPVTKAQLTVGGLKLEAAYEGLWGNYLRARIDTVVSPDAATNLGVPIDELFNLTIRDTQSGATELFRNLTWIASSSRFVTNVLKNDSRLVRVGSPAPTARPTPNGNPAPGADIFEDDTASTKVSLWASDGNRIEKTTFTGSGKEDGKKGLFSLEQADLFNLLCIPPYKDGDVETELLNDAIPYCEKRRALLLIDPPVGWKNKEQAKEGIDTGVVGRVSKNAAVFFPRFKQPNPLRSNQMEDFAPCGGIAGIFARTDTQRGVWKAPAGLDSTLTGVPQLSVPLTDNENGELNPKGINCLRSMPAVGPVVWGSRTREGDDRLTSEWKYIPVRRTALFIEESLYRGTQWVVFEPNDEPLWAQIRLNIGAFMQNLFRQGAFQGVSPRDAYFVKCDKETTTQIDINLGIVNIIVGFAPLKPAEFVVIKLQQMAGQIAT